MACALIVVDVQHDFCEGGALPVTGGIGVASRISDYLEQHAREYDTVVATADWHVDPGGHWSDTPDFVDSWPVHCRAGTEGAAFRPEVESALRTHADAVFRKGAYEAAYSGFEGTTGGEPEAAEAVPLGDWLRGRGVDAVDVVGLAADHCVRATALDAAGLGLRTRVLRDLTAGVEEGTTTAALDALREAGVTIA